MGTKKIDGDVNVTGTLKINNVALVNGLTITQIATTTLGTPSQDPQWGDRYYLNACFENIDESRLRAAKLIIINIADGYIITPLAQNGSTLTVGAFAYSSNSYDNNYMPIITRVRISIETFLQVTRLYVNFDYNYAGEVYNNNMASGRAWKPTCYLSVVE